MAMAADSSANHHSPRGPEFACDGGGAVNKRATPWAKVVRGGGDSEAVHQSPPSSSSTVEQTPFSDCSPSAKAARSSPPPPPPPPMVDGSSATDSPNGHNGNAARPKMAAWSKPSNGVVEVSPVTVMGAVSWPALSESARASPKLPADSSSPKTVSDATVTHGSLPVSQGPAVTHPPNSKRHPSSNANSNSQSNHTLPARQRPTKRGGGSVNTGGAHAHSGFGHPPTPPPPPPFPVFPILPNGYGNLVPAMSDTSPRDPSFRASSWDARPVGGFVPQSHPVNDHRPSRRGNFGPHARGDGSYHNNHGGKRDQDRGNYMNARDVHMHQHRAPPRGLVRLAPPPPPNSATFPPQPARPFANPMGFPEFVYIPTLPVDPIRGMPFISQAPHPAMFVPVAETPLPTLIVNQIDYYFSDANLIKDDFLKSNMDAHGWVPISLIANFPRVKGLTTNVQLILDSLRASSIVEVQDDKVRKRNEWIKWIPTGGQLPPDTLATSLEKVTVDEGPPSQNSMAGNLDPDSVAIPETDSTESTGQSQYPNGDVTQTTH